MSEQQPRRKCCPMCFGAEALIRRAEFEQDAPPLPRRTKGEYPPSIVEAAEAFSGGTWDQESARRLVASRAAEIAAEQQRKQAGRFRKRGRRG